MGSPDSEMTRIHFKDCVVNATIALLQCGGTHPVNVVEAQSIHAQTWLKLADTLQPGGWVDIPSNLISVVKSV